jgi:hypothetical protein
LMPTPTLNDPVHWRRRAAETRSIADQLDDPAAKKAMLEIAEQYERIAAIAQKGAVAAKP